MADKLEGMPSTMQLVNPETGEITSEWYDWLEEFAFGSSQNSVGTLLSGLNSTTAKTNGLIAGTQTVADVLITGRGSLSAEQDAQDGNIESAGESDGSFTATANQSYASDMSAGSGSKTTNSITITPSGGIAPYFYSWAKKSGDDIPADSASAATTTFSGTVTTYEFKTAVYTCAITDSTGGTPLTTTVDVSVSIGDISEFGS